MSEPPPNLTTFELEQIFNAADVPLAQSLLSELQDALEPSVFTVCILAVQSAPTDQRLDVLAFCHELREMPAGERLGAARTLLSAASTRRLEEFALLRRMTVQREGSKGLWDVLAQNVSGMLDGFTHPILINYLKRTSEEQRPLAYLKAEKALAIPGAVPRFARALGLLAEAYRS